MPTNSEQLHTAYSFAARQKGSRCAQILASHGAKKIIPRLTSDEVKWVKDYSRAKRSRDLAGETSIVVTVLTGALSAAIVGGMATDTENDNVNAVKSRRPAPHLKTEPKD